MPRMLRWRAPLLDALAGSVMRRVRALLVASDRGPSLCYGHTVFFRRGRIVRFTRTPERARRPVVRTAARLMTEALRPHVTQFD